MNYIVTCCSTVDLSESFLKEKNIPYVCFHFNLDGKDYKDDYGHSYPIDAFYKAIENGAMPTTSQVSVGEYIDFFEPFLKEGKDILHLTLSTGISGSYNSACTAATTLNANYEHKVTVIDSLCASGGYGLLAVKAKENLDKGMSLEENATSVKDMIQHLNHWFFSTDLTSFIRGGRISKVSGFAGNMLHICPLMTVDPEGHLTVKEKIRTKHKTMQEVINVMEKMADNGTDYSGEVYITQSACMEDALQLKQMIEDHFPHTLPIQIFNIGTTIGTHTGPGTVALFFFGKERSAA